MNYEKKYLKYKNKYLELVLKKQTEQRYKESLNLQGQRYQESLNLQGGSFIGSFIKKNPKAAIGAAVIAAAAGIAGIAAAYSNKSSSGEPFDDHDVDGYYNINKFIQAREAKTYDNLLLQESISNVNVHNNDNRIALHNISYIGNKNNDVDIQILIYYLLTCDPPADVNFKDYYGRTPMWQAAGYNNVSTVKALIEFGGDRTIKTDSDIGAYSNMTPLDFAKEINNKEIIELLEKYFPTEEQKLISQLEYKLIVDTKFKNMGQPRFKQDQIDLKYDSLSKCIDAVKTGSLDLLTQSLPHVDVRMAVSLTIIVIKDEKNKYYHLMECLFEKLVKEDAFAVITDKESIEPLLLTGLGKVTSISNSPEIVLMVNKSRVLSLFKILYDKFIFLGAESMFQLIQILMYEELKDSEK